MTSAAVSDQMRRLDAAMRQKGTPSDISGSIPLLAGTALHGPGVSKPDFTRHEPNIDGFWDEKGISRQAQLRVRL
jgi:hypothetical protein